MSKARSMTTDYCAYAVAIALHYHENDKQWAGSFTASKGGEIVLGGPDVIVLESSAEEAERAVLKIAKRRIDAALVGNK